MKLNITHTAKVQKAIEEVESRAHARRIDADDVLQVAREAERKLLDRLYKKDWVGVVVHVDVHAQKFPASYNGTPESTQFTLERFATGWFLTKIERSETKGPTGRLRVDFSAKGDALIRFAEDTFGL